MAENRYLVEYEVLSHCILGSDPSLIFRHPKHDSSIELRNKEVEPGPEFATLSAFLTFSADTLEDAGGKSDEVIKEFIDMLTFSTNMNIQVGDKLKIVDWTPGVEEREFFLFNNFPGDERPYPVITDPLLRTIEVLLKDEIPPQLRMALKWFSHGVSAKYMDEQFQYFYFVIELLAQVVRPTGKVNDLCARCSEPLYCKTCEDYPMHKPYPKQAIQWLFTSIVKGEGEKAFEYSNLIRNKLMHGDSLTSTEEETGVPLSTHVDVVGKTAWFAIINVLKSTWPAGEVHQLNLIETSTYCDIVLKHTTRGSFTSPDPNAPKIEEIPTIDVSRTFD